MPKSQPLRKTTFNPVPAAIEPASAAEKRIPRLPVPPDGKPIAAESPARRAHRVRMKAVLASAKRAN